MIPKTTSKKERRLFGTEPKAYYMCEQSGTVFRVWIYRGKTIARPVGEPSWRTYDRKPEGWAQIADPFGEWES